MRPVSLGLYSYPTTLRVFFLAVIQDINDNTLSPSDKHGHIFMTLLKRGLVYRQLGTRSIGTANIPLTTARSLMPWISSRLIFIRSATYFVAATFNHDMTMASSIALKPIPVFAHDIETCLTPRLWHETRSISASTMVMNPHISKWSHVHL
jgi:hypothetical protein